MKRAIAAAALLLTVVACSDGHKAALERTQWKLVQADGIPTEAIDREADFFTISFDATAGRVNGMTNCNRFFGNYKVNGRQIDFDNMGMTRMACPDGQYEQMFTELLDEADRFEVRDRELRLYDDKRLLATFKAVEGSVTRSAATSSPARSAATSTQAGNAAATAPAGTHADSAAVTSGKDARREMRREERVEQRDDRRDARDAKRDDRRDANRNGSR